jgi:hypothetical protein
MEKVASVTNMLQEICTFLQVMIFVHTARSNLHLKWVLVVYKMILHISSGNMI